MSKLMAERMWAIAWPSNGKLGIQQIGRNRGNLIWGFTGQLNPDASGHERELVWRRMRRRGWRCVPAWVYGEERNLSLLRIPVIDEPKPPGVCLEYDNVTAPLDSES